MTGTDSMSVFRLNKRWQKRFKTSRLHGHEVANTIIAMLNNESLKR